MEAVGCVRVQVSALEGLRLVLQRVARVIEWVVGGFLFASSACLVHAVADCSPGGVKAGPGGCRGKQPLGLVLRVPWYGGAGVGV